MPLCRRIMKEAIIASGARRLIKVRNKRLFTGKILAYITNMKRAVASVPRPIILVAKDVSQNGADDGSKRQPRERRKAVQYHIIACLRKLFCASIIMHKVINSVNSSFILSGNLKRDRRVAGCL